MMRTLLKLSLVTLAVVALATLMSPGSAYAQSGGGYGYRVGGFLDENGDGYNDLAPDADGDGIPNGMDPDYNPPLDGTGNQFGPGEGDPACAGGETGAIHRLMYKWQRMWARMFGGGGTTSGTFGWGPGDGTGNGGVGPGDGTGYGPGDGCLERVGTRLGNRGGR